MTTRQNLLKKLPLMLLVSGLLITAAFAQTGSGNNKTSRTDTVPKKQKQIRNLDEALQELDKGEAELQKAFQEFDGEKIGREVREAMKSLEVDMAKMKVDMDKAIKDFDAQKINLEVQKAMTEMQKALKEVDAEKIKADVQASLAKVDMEKVKAEMEKLRETEFPKIKKELEAVRPEMEKALQEARKSIEFAKQELTGYKNFVNALDKDGYLKKEANYKVEYKNGELTVNGKKLSSDVVKKYSDFLSGKKDFTLKKDDDDFNINK